MLNSIKCFYRQTVTVATRDFNQLCLSPLFFIFTGISCILFSYMFPRDLFRFAASYSMPAFQAGMEQTRNIHFDVFVSHISYINLILLFCVPILTMKLLAEEKKNRTFDLLMTAPLSTAQMVAGKYLALIATLTIFLLVTLVYPLATTLFTEVPIGPLISSYIGLFLLMATYTAIGLFTSSLTSSLFLSVFMGVILNISLWFISQGQGSQSPFLTATMEYLSLSNHLTNFVKGSVVIQSCAFFITFITLFLFLVYKMIEFSRWKS